MPCAAGAGDAHHHLDCRLTGLPYFPAGRAPAKGAELRAQQKKRRAENAAFKQDGTTKQPCVGQAFPGTVKPQQRVGLEGGWDLYMPVNPNR